MLAAEVLILLDDLVAAGVCSDIKNAIHRAAHSYALAILPQAYQLVRKGQAYP